jgi:hypothetical protein
MFTDAMRAEIAEYMQNVIRSEPGGISDADLAVRAQARFGAGTVLNAPENRLLFMNVARQARAGVAAGDLFDSQPGQDPRPTQLPYDPSLHESGGAYGYRIVVTMIDPDTGEEFRSLQLIVSDTPLSFSELRDRAIDAVRQNPRGSPGAARLRGMRQEPAYYIEVVGAGRAVR